MSDMENEVKVFVLVIGLAIVQAILVPGPLRENLEIWLVLQFVPVVDFIIQWGKLASSTEVGSVIYYVKFFIILLQDIATVYFYKLIKDRIFSK